MALRVLGPLEVGGPDGAIPLGGARSRALLSALAIRRGSACTTDELIDAVWGEAPPASASKLLQIYVSRLRKVLPTDLRIVTTPTGYALEIGPADLDAARFEAWLGEGRVALEAANPALAASTLTRALALWRGPAYADVRYQDFAGEEIERLERLRELALEARIDADLRLGRHAEILGELRGLVAAEPTSEQRAAPAMLAAYRTAGPPEALAIFARLRDAMSDELGEEPSQELQELRDRIARRDPGLALEPHDPAAAPQTALPVPPNALLGRERELAEVRALLSRPGVRFVSLTGAGGSGKSRLALEVARDLAGEYANGVAFVELASLSDPDLVPATIGRALGIESGADPMATLLDAVASREMLLVLDNFEHLLSAAPGLVRMLANAPRLVLLVTSRVVLHVTGEYVFPVGPLGEADAVALFGERAAALDPSFALDETTRPTVAAICRRLDGLPLAIELAAAGVRALGLPNLDARLASRLTALTAGPRDLPARQQTLRETLAWSVNLLDPRHADVLAALAVFPGSWPIDAAAAVAGADDDAIISLVDHHLVQAFDSDGERRLRLLETVRAFALELLGERRAATEAAMTQWMVHVVRLAWPGELAAPRLPGFRRIDAELDSLRDALRYAAADPNPENELVLASRTGHFWWVRGLLAEAREIYDGILARRGMVHTAAGIQTARAAAAVAWSMGDVDRAWTLGEQALAAADDLGDLVGRVDARNLVGAMATHRREFDVAESHLQEGYRLAEAAGNLEFAYLLLLNLGVNFLESGQFEEARQRFQAVLDYRSAEGQTEGVAFAQLNLGETALGAGDAAAAEVHFAAALEGFQVVGFKVRVANALQGLAAAEVRTGREAAAARHLGAAATLMADIGWRADGSAHEPETTSMAREMLGGELFNRYFNEGAAVAPE